MRNIYRNTFFIWCLVVFPGLQKDRELFNASRFLTLIWSHSVIKSSLMVLFFRLSASRSFFFFFFYNKFFSYRPNCLNHWAMKPLQDRSLIFFILALSLITHSILDVNNRLLLNVCRMKVPLFKLSTLLSPHHALWQVLETNIAEYIPCDWGNFGYGQIVFINNEITEKVCS